jgi:hypothetical protein
LFPEGTFRSVLFEFDRDASLSWYLSTAEAPQVLAGRRAAMKQTLLMLLLCGACGCGSSDP